MKGKKGEILERGDKKEEKEREKGYKGEKKRRKDKKKKNQGFFGVRTRDLLRVKQT